MFGYMIPSPARLDASERERFRSAYCGLCRTLGKRYGTAARFLLNYDFTVMAILLAPPQEPACRACRCMAHPIRARRACCEAEHLSYAADCSVVLAWWQIQDHIADRGVLRGLPYRAASILLRRSYRKAERFVPQFAASVRRRLAELHALEAARCPSLDEAAEPFAELLASIADGVSDARERRILSQLFYHMGRWIYLIDAADDFTSDQREGCYNPLRYRYALDGDSLSAEVKSDLALTLDLSVQRMAAAYELSDHGVWSTILSSIFYESLYGIGRAVLDGTWKKRKKDARKSYE